MQRNHRWRFVKLIIIGLQLAACQQQPEAEAPPNFDQTRAGYTGPSVHRVRLTAKRAAELGIETTPVREEKIAGVLRKVVPAAAVLRDQQGSTWTFKSPDSLVFVRERVSVEHFEGDLAILSDGPPVGAAVVTVGAEGLFQDESSDRMFEGYTRLDASRKGTFGTATMQKDGTLRVVYKTTGATGLSANIVVVYKPQDEEYVKIIAQVGGLKMGETKNIPASLAR